jgi:hypothetical protein
MGCSDPDAVTFVSNIVKDWELFVFFEADPEFVNSVAANTKTHLSWTEGGNSILYHPQLSMNPLGAYEYTYDKEDSKGKNEKRVLVVELEWHKSLVTLFIARFVVESVEDENHTKNEVVKKILETTNVNQRALFVIGFEVENFRLAESKEVHTLVRPNFFSDCCTGSDWSPATSESTTMWSFKPKAGTWDNILYHRLHLSEAEVLKQRDFVLSAHHPVRTTLAFHNISSESSASEEGVDGGHPMDEP